MSTLFLSFDRDSTKSLVWIRHRESFSPAFDFSKPSHNNRQDEKGDIDPNDFLDTASGLTSPNFGSHVCQLGLTLSLCMEMERLFLGVIFLN